MSNRNGTCSVLMNHGSSALEMNSLMHVFKKLNPASANHLPHVSILSPMKTVSSPGPTCM